MSYKVHKPAIKCYWSALESLVAEKPLKYKGKGKLTLAMQKTLTSAEWCATNMQSAEKDTKCAIELLHWDLQMGQYTALAFTLIVALTTVKMQTSLQPPPLYFHHYHHNQLDAPTNVDITLTTSTTIDTKLWTPPEEAGCNYVTTTK